MKTVARWAGRATLGLALIALLGSATVSRGRADSVTGTATISAGTLTEVAGAWAPISVTLNGADQLPTTTMPMTVLDATGSGSGWNVTVTSTTFTTGGGTPRTLSTTATAITQVTSACVVSVTCTNPTNTIAYPLTVPADATAPAAVKFFNATSSSGLGQFTLTSTFRVAIPANTYAGTYTSLFTFTIASAP